MPTVTTLHSSLADAAGQLCHELRRPLTSMRAFAELLDDRIVGELNAEQGDFVERILHNADRMNRQLQSIYEYASAVEGRAIHDPRSVDLVVACEETVAGLLGQTGERGVEVRFEAMHPSLPVHLDQSRFARSIQAIVDYLIGACPGVERIELVLERQGARAALRLSPCGQALDAEAAAGAFEAGLGLAPYVGEGLAIDLALCRATVAAHGGAVELEGEGVRAHFLVELPTA